jgi:hypothetical protein
VCSLTHCFVYALSAQLYEDGDDQMKKTIGEAMIKSRQEQNDPSAAGL